MTDYESSRLVFNRAFNRHPGGHRALRWSLQHRALSRFCPDQEFAAAVRSVGHSRLGCGMCDGGMVIDLSALKRVEVDASKRTARAEAGALVRDPDEATQRFELATTSGGCPTARVAWRLTFNLR